MKTLGSQRYLAPCLGLLLGLCTLVPGAWGQRAALSMRVPAMPTGATDLGVLPASQPLTLTLYLAPSVERQAALTDYLQAVQTPGNALYRVWLTPVEFAEQFGATADQIAAVNAFAQGAGLTVTNESASGLRVVVSGSDAQMEAAFAPAMHSLQVGSATYYANTQAASLPTSMAANVLAVGGLSDLPSAEPMTVGVGAGAGVVAADALEAMSDVVDADSTRVMTLSSASCLEDFGAASQLAMQLTLEQANAEGMTVLAATGCGARGSAGFPSVLSEATSVAIAPGVTLPATANLATNLLGARPAWQSAQGLPADGLRHEPDVTVSSLSALAGTMMSILAQQPVAADGSAPRLGNINATLYELAAEPGLYTQPDSAPNGSAAAGTWEPATGLGLVNLSLLDKFYPHGSLSDNVSISLPQYSVTHGQTLTFNSTVTDTSGQGNGVVPTGTVSFTTNTGVALGSATLSGGTGQVTYNQLDGGTYTVTAAYSGDGTYAAGQSVVAQFYVGPEAAIVSGTASPCTVGGQCQITVTVKSTSGIGTPSGTVTVNPQGTSDHTAYTGTLIGTGGTAVVDVPVAAVQGGADVFQVNCTTSATFTCYSGQDVTVQVTKGTPSMTVMASPTAPTAGQTDTITATVSGNGGIYPTPTGNVDFYDNGVDLGPATLNNGTATYTTQTLVGASHSFSATYDGDNNYATTMAQAGSTSSGASITSLQLQVAPNPPVAGSTTTLLAAIGYSTTNGAAPTGTINFYEDGALLGALPVSSGQASYSSTALSGTTAHQFYAVYTGDSNYQTSTSGTVMTVAAGSGATTSTVLTVTPNPPVSGSLTTLYATITGISSAPSISATVSFYEDGVLLGTSGVQGASSTAAFYSTTISGTTAHTFYAVFSGTSAFASSQSPTVTTTASGSGTGTTRTVLTVAPNPPVNGSLTSLEAGVYFSGAAPTTATTVTFYEDGVLLATEPLNGNFDDATYYSQNISGTTSHTFYAVYNGNSMYASSTSPTVTTASSTATVSTTTALTVSPNPPVNGNTTTLIAAVSQAGSASSPSGSVNFYEDSTLIGVGTVAGGSASFTSTTISGTASHSFYAIYSGDSTFLSSTSATVMTASSGATATSTTLTVTPNPPVSGSTTTLIATVSQTGSASAPSGSVNFYEDSTLIGIGTVAGGSASFTSTTISGAASHSFYAIYSGDSTFMTSTSATVTTAASSGSTTTTTLTVTPNPPVSGSLTTLIASITGISSAPSINATVSFYEDGVLLGTGGVQGASSTASFYTTSISGTTAHTFYAVFNGATNFSASTSPTVTTVASGSGSATSTTSLTVSPNPPVSGENTTLTASVTYVGGASTATVGRTIHAHSTGVTPTGTVTFFDNGAAQATVGLSNGSASYSSTSFGGSTANSFYAVYSGDTTYAASTSPTVNTTSTTTNEETITTVSAASASVPLGGTDVLTGTVTPISIVNGTALTGTLTFNSAQGTLCVAAISSGKASCTATLTLAGVQSITAVYSGDQYYAASTSLSPASVNVGATSSGGVLSVSASPSAGVMYGNTITLSSTLTPTTAVNGGPAGTVTFTLAGTVTLSYTAALVSNGSTSATGTYAIPTPAPGTYVVTVTCASSNVTCTGLSATTSLTVIKGNTVNTLTSSPTSPLVGQTTTFTSTVLPANGTLNSGVTGPTGTVTFYINGVSNVVALSNGVATYSTVLTAQTGNFVTAVYSGDTNWNGSNSSQLDVLIAPIPTTSTLTANETTALYTANIVLTDNVLVAPTTFSPYPNSPTGTVTYYDEYNGQPTLLGTASLTQIALGDSVAQLSTTGLLKGTHYITALFNANTTYGGSTASLVVNITDYSVTFSPQTISLSPGSSGASIATITSYNGFSGQVALGCTPPPGEGITCTISPSVITGSGTSILTVQTTVATAMLRRPSMGRGAGRGATAISLATLTFASLLLGFLLPRRKRFPLLLVVVLAAAVLGGSVGCTTQGIVNTQSTSGSGASNQGGTPLGTQLLAITTQGTDGMTTVRHNTQFQVTVQ